VYHYSNGRPDQETSCPHNTPFQERPGETPYDMKPPLHQRAKALVKDLTPPIKKVVHPKA
jgi:hypothetical protein